MSHAFLFVPAAGQTEAPSFHKGVRALGEFKAVQITDSATSTTASLAVAPSAKATQITKGRIARSADGQVWIADLGLWLPLPAEHGRDVAWLIEQYLAHGAEGLARRLQGLFALLIVDQRSRQAHVITDRCGSLHIYWRQLADGVAVCSSSAVLAQCAPSTLDPVGVHEFIATGILYEDRSLWQGIRKIGPATVFTFGRDGTQAKPYWQFSAVRPESFAQVLDPILAAKADTRFRSLLARRLFQRFASPLARIPLEHGYPPVPASIFNLQLSAHSAPAKPLRRQAHQQGGRQTGHGPQTGRADSTPRRHSLDA